MDISVDTFLFYFPWTCMMTLCGFLFHILWSNHKHVIQIRYTKKESWAKEFIRRLDESVGYDLFSPKDLVIRPLETITVDTGIILEMPSYLKATILEKSSIASTTSLHIRGGLIDPCYRGNIGVILWNHDPKTSVKVKEGTALAQIVFDMAVIPKLKYVEDVDSNTLRGTRGFGGRQWIKDGINTEDQINKVD